MQCSVAAIELAAPNLPLLPPLALFPALNCCCRRVRALVCCRETKQKDEAGVTRREWYLVDSRGVRHKAVVGVERETRDGHYHYNLVRARCPLRRACTPGPCAVPAAHDVEGAGAPPNCT